MALPNVWFFQESTDGQISCFKPETGQVCRNPEEISSAPKADGLNELRRNVPAIGPPIPRTTTKKDTDTPIGSTEPTSFAGIRCHFFNGRPRSCHQGERCAFSHKSVISVTRRRKEQRFRAAQAAQRKPDGPAGLPDLESPTRHSDASKPNAQRTTGGFSNLTEELLLFGFWYRTRCRRHRKEGSFYEPGEADQPVGPSRPTANRLLGSLPLVGVHRHRPR